MKWGWLATGLALGFLLMMALSEPTVFNSWDFLFLLVASIVVAVVLTREAR